MSIIYFVLFLGFLIFFHEFGHYSVARLLGIKVLTFSFGFGPKLVGIKIGDTDYQISAIPLGGYVRMLGDDPEDLPDRKDWDKGFLTAPIWKKSLIALAGPAFSLLLPFLAYMVIYSTKTSETASRIGSVLRNGPAWQAGIRPGDKIEHVGTRKINYWWQLKQEISSRPGQPVALTYSRNGIKMDTTVHTKKMTNPIYKMLGMKRFEGIIEVSPVAHRSTIDVMPGGLAQIWGLQTGDAILKVNGSTPYSFGDLKNMLKKCLRETGTCDLKVAKSGNESTKFNITIASLPGLPLSIQRADNLIKDVESDSPLAMAGLKKNDRILKVDNKPMYNPDLIVAGLLSQADRTHTITFSHNGIIKTIKFSLKNPKWHPGVQAPRYLDPGIRTYTFTKPVEMLPVKNRINYVASMSIQRGNRAIMVSVVSLWALVTGRVSMKEMGGPIMIYDIAGKAGRSGWMTFLSALAWISASIGLLNLLPIPVLDGGHLLLFSIEAIRRKQISLKARQIATYIGFSVLMALMVLVFANDIMRKMGLY